MPTEPIRVLLVDDHVLYRRGLQAFLDLEPDITVVGEASDGAAGVEAARTLRPDVVILDVQMPRTSGPEACALIVDAPTPPKVLMLTASHDDADLFDSIRAGASGYLLKDAPPDDVGPAVRAVCQGHSLIPPSMAARLLAEFAQLSRPATPELPTANLTDREREVLTLVARGRKNREIAELLFISENTVKNHVRNILDKLHLHSRVEAAMYAVRTNLVDPDEQRIG